MKKIVSVSLGKAEHDYEFTGNFLGKKFQVKRVGCEGRVARGGVVTFAASSQQNTHADTANKL